MILIRHQNSNCYNPTWIFTFIKAYGCEVGMQTVIVFILQGRHAEESRRHGKNAAQYDHGCNGICSSNSHDLCRAEPTTNRSKHKRSRNARNRATSRGRAERRGSQKKREKLNTFNSNIIDRIFLANHFMHIEIVHICKLLIFTARILKDAGR